MEEIITNLVVQLPFVAVFLWLFVKERQRTHDVREEHIRDLRYISSIRHDRLGAEWNGGNPPPEDLEDIPF